MSTINVCPFILYCFIEKHCSSCIIISGGQALSDDDEMQCKLLESHSPAQTGGCGNQPSPGHLNKTDDIERTPRNSQVSIHYWSIDGELRNNSWILVAKDNIYLYPANS